VADPPEHARKILSENNAEPFRSGSMSWSVEPTDRPVRVDAELVSCTRRGGANRSLVLRVPGWPGFAPGQFVMLSPGPRNDAPRSDPLLPRPMAVYRARGEDVEILLKVTGRGTALLAAARPGDRVGVVGPLGRAFPVPGPGERAVLVGGGTGIASLYELAARIGSEAQILLGARSADDLMGRDDFRDLGADLQVTTEDGSEGVRGRVTDLLASALEGGGARVYACGPTPMMESAARIAERLGASCVVSLENAMACGFGVCLGCVAPLASGGYALVCREGPMFDAQRIDWQGLP
jgi:dihydroorotate dehydrogenase electron transfer subunit